ncbi:RNA polymerase factor sigma-54 [uncultured Flavonifractor sp.]|nr:RNA polymerase factor sigma-54 [uncultured Flavonifractor sp.]
MELSMNLRQTQTLSPQMVQSMEILQMGSQELLEFIEETTQANPVLEVDEKYDRQDEFDLMRRKLEWLESTDVQNSWYHRQDAEEDADPMANYGGVENGEEDLYRYVLSQLGMLSLERDVMAAAVFVVESLNQNGWLDDDVPALAAAFGCRQSVMERALDAVQGLEPAGVAARNLSECLRLQLLRRGGDNALTLEIVAHHLDALARSRFGLIAKELGTSAEEVREACALIKTLNPKPGTGFAARENLTYINPDIIVVSFPDHFEVLANDYFFPSLHMSGYYQQLMKDTDDQEVKDYLTDKVRQAKWVVRSIEQRRSTLLSCAQCILALQEPFFRQGPGHLSPMSLADVAQRLEVHESTVSRAIRDKYLQCSMGVYPLSYFFSRGLGGSGDGEEGASPEAAKILLRKLIEEEDKAHPHSDQKLSQLMGEQGCTISRRTVAKYRDELGIPSTTGRRQYEKTM